MVNIVEIGNGKYKKVVKHNYSYTFSSEEEYMDKSKLKVFND
jgi:hypothetical protein